MKAHTYGISHNYYLDYLTKGDSNKFYNKEGWLTAHALLLGYIEECEFNDYTLLLYKVNGLYTVALDNDITKEQDSYSAFNTITEARYNFNTLKRHINSGFIKAQ